MSWTIIVASSQADQLEELIRGAQQIAARTSPPDTKLVMALSVEDVQRKRSCDPATELLIVAASLPNRESSPDRQTEPGFSLVKCIGQVDEPPACILVSESDRIDHYRAIQGIKRCEWLAVDYSTNYVEQCVQLARKLGIASTHPASTTQKPHASVCADGNGVAALPVVPAPPTAADPPPANGSAKTHALLSVGAGPQSIRARRRTSAVEPYALIEVNLPSQAEFATVSLDVRRPDAPIRTASNPLKLRPEQVQELIEKSRQLKKLLSDDRWHAEYRALGQQIHAMLADTLFGKYYERASGAVGENNVRLRFNLDGPTFEGLWEAIFEAPHFLMTKNTITRRAIQAFDEFPNQLGGGDGTLNVLVIKSDVPHGSTPKGPDDPFWEAYWASLGIVLPKLSHLDEEVAVLRGLAADAARNIHVDVLPDPGRREKGWSLANEVEHALKQEGRRYDVVHFAGHALFAPSTEEEDARGYLIFSGQPKPHAVTIARVADWLALTQVQLVYLSCCRSSAAPAALEFARKNVPMAIGFNCDLDDKKAVDFARTFYAELLDNRLKVCRAFRGARSKLHDEYGAGDPIWASPVLIAQPMDWIKVEGVLRPTSHERRTPPRPPRAGSPHGRMTGLRAARGPASLVG